MPDIWMAGHGTDADGPFVLRLNETFKDEAARAELPVRLMVSMIGEPVVRPMLQSEELRGQLEEKLVALAAQGGGKLAATIARPHRYTFLLYIQEGALDATSLTIPDELRDHMLVEIEPDPDWSEYRSWLPAEE